MSRDKRGHFKVLSKTKFKDLADGTVDSVSESDLCFQNETDIIQFEYIKVEEEEKYEIEPGSFILTDSMSGLELKKFEMKKRDLLENVASTSIIMKEATVFFSRLHIYEKLNRAKKRGVLVYSDPGCGKTSSIEKVSRDLM